MKTIVLLLLLCLFSTFSFAQSITLSPGTAQQPAMINISNAYQKGVEIPQATTVERLKIPNPSNGLTVFDTDKKGVCTYYQKAWYCSSKDSIVDYSTMQNFSPDSAANDKFGHAVDISGYWAVVGAAQTKVGNNANQGAAYYHGLAYGGESWLMSKKLVAPDGAANDNFGASVALVGNYMVIGAPGANANTGAVYIFKQTSGVWTQEAKLTAADGATGDRFGATVDFYMTAANVPFVTVSTTGDDLVSPAVSNIGSVYVFSPSAGIWTFQQKIMNTAGSANEGTEITARMKDENTIVVAKPKARQNEDYNNGKIYTYRKTGSVWNLVQTFTGSAHDNLGHDLGISGNYMVVGGARIARVYQYNTNTNLWSNVYVNLASPHQYMVYYGYSVAIDGDRILVRDVYDHFGVFFKRTGATNNTWVAYQTISTPGFCYNTGEGHLTAISDGYFVAGEGSNYCQKPGEVRFGFYNDK